MTRTPGRRLELRSDPGPRAQQLNGHLTPLVVRPVHLHAKSPELYESMFTMRAEHGYECTQCDYSISWHRVSQLRRCCREAGRFPARITLPTPFEPVPCGWCWRTI